MKISDHEVPPFRPLVITIESQQELVTLWAALNMSTIYGCKKAVVENGISEDLYSTRHVDVLWKALRDRLLCTVPNSLPVLFSNEADQARLEQTQKTSRSKVMP